MLSLDRSTGIPNGGKWKQADVHQLQTLARSELPTFLLAMDWLSVVLIAA